MRSTLWTAAEVLRDRVDASTARDVVLTLIAVRHLEPDAWPTVAEQGLVPVLRTIIERRPELETAFPTLPDLRDHRADELISALDDIPSDAVGDALGEAYMHLLGEFARAEGRRGGQYYTPSSVTQLAVQLIEPIQGVVYDPCCGSGGLLIQAAGAASERTQLVGQELNPATRRLARLNAAVHDLDLDLGTHAADTLAQDLHPDMRADRVVANPPFNLARWDVQPRDPRWAAGVPPTSNANLAWVQHIWHHLAPGGRAAVILANGSLTARGDERAIRAALVRRGAVEAVVALPDMLFLTTPIPACVWVLHKGPAADRPVIFVDARTLGRRETPSLRVLDPADRQRIVEVLRVARAGGDPDRPGFAAAVPRERVAERGDLNPGSWVAAARTERPAESIAALVDRALRELGEAQALDEALREALRHLDTE